MVISRLIPGNFLDIGPIFVDTDPAGYETGRELGKGRGDERIDPIFSISRIIYHDLVTTFVCDFPAKCTRVCRL